MSREISFKTLAMSPAVGAAYGKCRCTVVHTEVLSGDVLARDMAQTMHIDIVDARHYADLVTTYMARALSRGCRLNFGAFSLSLSIRGTVDGANGAFTPGVNSVRVNIQAGDDLKEALAAMCPVNATAFAGGITPRITSVLDSATKEHDTVTPGATTFVAGSDILIDTEAQDEGVWLESGGRKVMKGTVTATGSTTLDCVFPAGLVAGDYWLVIYTRNGDPTRASPSKTRRKVLVLDGW